MTIPDRPFLTTGEVAAAMGLSYKAVAGMFDRGVLAGYRIAPRPRNKHRREGHRRIERASVVALIEGLGLDHASLKLDFHLHELERTK